MIKLGVINVDAGSHEWWWVNGVEESSLQRRESNFDLRFGLIDTTQFASVKILNKFPKRFRHHGIVS